MPRPSIYKNDPCDIVLNANQRMLLFDAGLTAGTCYWTIHGKVAMVIKGRSSVVLAATPDAAVREAIDNGGL
jgi:hypothetical protein